jgi:hypothetical protein
MGAMRAVAVALLGALALAVGGCGGGEVAASQAASLLKPGAIAYLELFTDPESEQWKQAEELLRTFPDGDRWIAQLRREYVEDEGLDWERDVKPALGDRTIVVAYPASEAGEPFVVGLTNADDPDKTVALFKKFDQEDARPTVTRVVDGWIAISDKEAALQAALNADGGQSLADDEGFKAAVAELPDDALGRVYVDPAAVVSMTGPALKMLGLDELDFVGAWTKAREDGAELSILVGGAGADKLLGSGEPYASDLLERVPEDAFAFVSFDGAGLRRQLERLGDQPMAGFWLRGLERELGVSLDQLARIFGGEVAFFARHGSPNVELTLLSETDDEAASFEAAKTLLRGLAAEHDGRITDDGGVFTVAFADALPVSVTTLDGVLVLTTARGGLDDLRSSSDKLPDSERFEQALDAASTPETYTGLAYVDLSEAIPAVEDYLSSREENSVPPDVRRNLEPLRTLVAYGKKDGDLASALVFLGID